MLKYIKFCLFFNLTLSILFSSELPNELLGLKLGDKYSNVKKLFILKKVKTENFYKIYKVSYLEENMETYVSFFERKIFKIEVSYKEEFIEESDWLNIYNQAISYYGQPKKAEVEQKGNFVEENYIWEKKNIKYIYQKIIQDGKIKKFTITLVDKNIEEKILNLPKIKKLYYKILNIFI